jgi:hypothetical protein
MEIDQAPAVLRRTLSHEEVADYPAFHLDLQCRLLEKFNTGLT